MLARLRLRPVSMEERLRLASHSVGFARAPRGRAVLTERQKLTHSQRLSSVTTACAVPQTRAGMLMTFDTWRIPLLASVLTFVFGCTGKFPVIVTQHTSALT